MYSRYKVREPSPPPDYAGTAFAGYVRPKTSLADPSDGRDGQEGRLAPSELRADGLSRPDSGYSPDFGPSRPQIPDFPHDFGLSGPDSPQNAGIAPDSGPISDRMPDSGADSSDEAKSGRVTLSDSGFDPDQRPPIDPDFTLDPEEEFPPETPESPETEPNPPEAGPEPSDPPESGSDGPENPEGSLFDRLSPDDLLFVGAMLYLLSGKNGNDSFLLLAYLLTCGL